jgi:Ca2+-binding RTX toxin-like protein
MKRRFRGKVLLVILALLTVLGAVTALAAANTVPITRIQSYLGPTIVPEDLKPAECSSIYVDEITAGSGTIYGTKSNNLILGSSLADTIYASNAGSKWLTNCIAGGAGDDIIYGSKKDEVILGGVGYDICYGGGGNDTFYSCEVIN